MKKLQRTLITCLFASVCVLMASAQSIYDFKVKDDVGKEVSLADYKGKVLLIVNTATRCGFTPQYKELEALYEKYKGEGLEILDFPCNQFGEQAPGTNEEIHDFCTGTYNTTFAQFAKIDVNGENEAPIFKFLKEKQGFKGFETENNETGKMMDQMMSRRDPGYKDKSDIKWNFTKFLVNKKGEVIARFEPSDSMMKLETAIRRNL